MTKLLTHQRLTVAAVIVSGVVLAGCNVFNQSATNNLPPGSTEYAGPGTVLDAQTRLVVEQASQVSTDDSLDTIEQELEETVILEEEFGSLE